MKYIFYIAIMPAIHVNGWSSLIRFLSINKKNMILALDFFSFPSCSAGPFFFSYYFVSPLVRVRHRVLLLL